MKLKVAQCLLAIGVIVCLYSVGIDVFHGVGSRSEYLRGTCAVFFAVAELVLVSYQRKHQKSIVFITKPHAD